MIRMQIIERSGADLHRTLIDAMRSGSLRTFHVKDRGRKVFHANPAYSGWMNWSNDRGMIMCEVVSPRKPGAEWQFFSAFMGRLADRYRDLIGSINVQFEPNAEPAKRGRRRKAR
jgi:hypothetical protein